jgi:hypothetical protein
MYGRLQVDGKVLSKGCHRFSLDMDLESSSISSTSGGGGQFLKSVYNDCPNLELTFYMNDITFRTSGYISHHNNRYWCTDHPHIVHEVPLHDAKIGVWFIQQLSLIILKCT